MLQRLGIVAASLPFALASALTAVDLWRRRGKRRPGFPVTDPETVQVGGSQVTAYTFGAHLYDDMLAAIDGARDQILLESYIWKADGIGRRFKQALEDAAARGVAVYVIYDEFANLVVPREFKRFDERLHVLAYPMYHAGLRFFDFRMYGRNHRKLLVVDEEIAFLGGFNIGSAYATEWRDTHVKVTGPDVWELQRACVEFWNLNHPPSHRIARGSDTDWDPLVEVHRNIPRVMVFPIRGMYLEAISRARHHIYLTHAYFIPDGDFVDALVAAAGRGVDVRLLLPATSNHVVADWLSRGHYSALLRGGVRIHLYHSMMHAKTATIDGRWSTVGTANIDRLSLTGNYEVNIEVIDSDFARQMEHIFRTDLTNSTELTREEWGRRGLHRRVAESVLAPLRPLL